MRISIIGAGSVGATLARHLAKLGHQVSIANSRGAESLTALAAEIGALGLPRDARALTCHEDGDVVESSSEGGPRTVREAVLAHLRGCGPAEQVQEIEESVFARA